MFRRGLSLGIGLVSLVSALTACSGDRLSNEEVFGLLMDGADGIQTVDVGHYLAYWRRGKEDSTTANLIESQLKLFERYDVYDKDIFRIVARVKEKDALVRNALGYDLGDEMRDLGDELRAVTGRFDFEEIRDQLYDEDYIDDEYRGYEIWQENSESGNATSLVDNYGLVVNGPLDEVKDFLRRLDRGAGRSKNVLKEIDEQFGDAWFAESFDGCGTVRWFVGESREFRECLASGLGILNTKEAIKVVGMFEDESSAKKESKAFEEAFRNLGGDNFVSSRRNGRFLEVVLERTPREDDE